MLVLKKHEVMNTACGEQYSLNDLLNYLQSITGKEIKAIYAPERLGDIQYSNACIIKITNMLSYQNTIGFKEGLSIVLNWYKKNEI